LQDEFVIGLCFGFVHSFDDILASICLPSGEDIRKVLALPIGQDPVRLPVALVFILPNCVVIDTTYFVEVKQSFKRGFRGNGVGHPKLKHSQGILDRDKPPLGEVKASEILIVLKRQKKEGACTEGGAGTGKEDS